MYPWHCFRSAESSCVETSDYNLHGCCRSEWLEAGGRGLGTEEAERVSVPADPVQDSAAVSVSARQQVPEQARGAEPGQGGRGAHHPQQGGRQVHTQQVRHRLRGVPLQNHERGMWLLWEQPLFLQRILIRLHLTFYRDCRKPRLPPRARESTSECCKKIWVPTCPVPECSPTRPRPRPPPTATATTSRFSTAPASPSPAPRSSLATYPR